MKWISILLLSMLAVGATNTAYDAENMSTINKNKVNFNGIGVSAIIDPSSTGVIDYEPTDDIFLTGAKTRLPNSCEDDKIKIQIMYGTTVVNQFIDWWAWDMDTELPIPSKIPKTHPVLGNAKIRAVYTNTCTVPIKVRINYHTYIIKE